MNNTRFTQGMRVIYVPGVARGDKTHPACEHGTVSKHQRDVCICKVRPAATEI